MSEIHKTIISRVTIHTITIVRDLMSQTYPGFYPGFYV